ncbi:cytochrome c biogenesis protein CcsA [Neolewinella antarctica]|uniref:Cytochrome c-type biogenesis protein CcmF n=1 Tax=Neolewinella antarctica TaxID=442734 RepID=A0ABX0X7F9_9BACT|nr:cytochrome c biogenesis protein CcsA [Neolewinella antarctica]NJC25150.1 cytochrome c-type biogenesis protein CcmF [Neolewinella antarctica]
MEEIQYIGEHLGPRYVGHFALLLAFFAGVLSLISYFLATQYRDERLRGGKWARLGQLSFLAHGAAVFTVIGTIFFAMLNQYYEYSYVQAHVSADLDQRYIFSAFWEGQEGSFLLWMFWHVILGYVLMVTARKWERPVMTVITSVQVVLASMVLGVHFGFGDMLFKLGSSPMLLLRETIAMPIFQQADYVDLLRGSGLNPSLQNYWMTIHPPTLFLGFASTIVPFSFAIAGLWLKDHTGWLKPALRWALFSGGILGIGILMGAAWAYEALNFGGYWAWDPVENTSLVPWLLLIAGIHTNLISRATGQGIRATYMFYLGTFVMIVYSTFMTRSGILGDTSVHAFTEMGMESQLLFFLAAYVLLSIGMLAWRWRSVPTPAKEESLSSREFWMFVGSLVLFMSAVLMTGATSLPVYNEIRQFFDPVFDGIVLADPVDHHNRFQIWIGIFIGIMSGIAHFLRWREQDFGTQWKSFALHTGAAVAGAVLLSWATTLWIDAVAWQYKLMLFAGWFAVWTNTDYLIRFARRDTKVFGSSLSHIGFGLLLIGILASGANKRIISKNTFLMEGLSADEELRRTTVILIKDEPMVMENYELTLRNDTIDGFNRTYFIDYKKRDAAGQIIEEFQLEPNLLYDKKFEKVAIVNPSTKHYWNRDVFTVIASLPLEEQSAEEKQAKEDSLKYHVYDLAVGEDVIFKDTLEIRRPDTFMIRPYNLELTEFSRSPRHPDYVAEPGDLGVSARINVSRYDADTVFAAQIALVLREGLLFHYPAQVNEIGTRVKIDESIFDELLVAEADLDYQEIKVKPGDQFSVGENQFTFRAFQPQPTVDHYVAQSGDIAVSAILDVVSADGSTGELQPVFIIRDNVPNRVRDEDRKLGLFANLINLDPESSEATLLIAQTSPKDALNVPIAVATNSDRSDWLALQAIEFPGINLVWIGTISMMLGLLINMVVRIRQRRRKGLLEVEV